MARTPGAKARRTLMAYEDIERLGIDVLENLMETRKMALDAYKSGRGLSDKGDAGVGYLGLVMRADIELLSLKYAKLSAIAFKDISDNTSSEKTISTAEAVEIIKNDPFSPPEIKNIETDRVLDAMKSNIATPFLPSGMDEINKDD